MHFDDAVFHSGFSRRSPLRIGGPTDDPVRLVQANGAYGGLRARMFGWVTGDAVDDMIAEGILVEYVIPDLVPMAVEVPPKLARGPLGRCARCDVLLGALVHADPAGFLCGDCAEGRVSNDVAVAAARFEAEAQARLAARGIPRASAESVVANALADQRTVDELAAFDARNTARVEGEGVSGSAAAAPLGATSAPSHPEPVDTGLPPTSAKAVVAWAKDDPVRARLALDIEDARPDGPRSTVLEGLRKVAAF